MCWSHKFDLRTRLSRASAGTGGHGSGGRLRGAGPTDRGEAAQPAGADYVALGGEQGSLHRQVAVAAQGAAGGDHPVIRHPRPVGPGQHVADRPGGARPPGPPGHVAVGGHAPGRDAGDDGEDPPREGVSAR